MSQIQWTDVTWNPTVGCTRVSAGCDNCYAGWGPKTLKRFRYAYEHIVVEKRRHPDRARAREAMERKRREG